MKGGLYIDYASRMTKQDSDKYFELVIKATLGMDRMQSDEKRALNIVLHTLDRMVTQSYLKRNFSQKSEKAFTTIAKNLKAVMAKRIAQAEWMTDKTKKRALKKLANFEIMVAKPDKWDSIDPALIKKGHLVESLIGINKAMLTKEYAKLGTKTPPRESYFNALKVNAYFSPTNNTVAFPVGILSPPFYDQKDLSDNQAAVYGAIGAVIGHELTHGFDDQGSQYDKDGNLKSWWPSSVLANFKEKIKCIRNQYSKYTIQDGETVNGNLTLGNVS